MMCLHTKIELNWLVESFRLVLFRDRNKVKKVKVKWVITEPVLKSYSLLNFYLLLFVPLFDVCRRLNMRLWSILKTCKIYENKTFKLLYLCNFWNPSCINSKQSISKQLVNGHANFISHSKFCAFWFLKMYWNCTTSSFIGYMVCGMVRI